MAGHVGVPGVRVDHVGPGAAADHLEVDTRACARPRWRRRAPAGRRTRWCLPPAARTRSSARACPRRPPSAARGRARRRGRRHRRRCLADTPCSARRCACGHRSPSHSGRDPHYVRWHDCDTEQEERPGGRPGGRRGQATDAPHRRPGQARGAVRRHLPADRLRPVQRRQLRLPQGRRADAVQVAQPRPAHHHHLADVHAARQLHHPGAGAAARRQALVPRQRRRDLPVAQPAHRRDARHRGRGRRRPRLPDGLLRHGRPARRVRRGLHGGRDPAADRARRPVRRHRRRPEVARPHPRVPGEAEGPGRAARLARRGARLDGQLRLRRPRTRRRRHARRRARAVQARHGRRHRAVVRRPQRVGRLRLQGQRGARLQRARPRLLARRRDDELLLRRPHGPRGAAAGVQPLQHQVADLHELRTAAAGEAGRGPRRASR